jgi:hypothetical protein
MFLYCSRLESPQGQHHTNVVDILSERIQVRCRTFCIVIAVTGVIVYTLPASKFLLDLLPREIVGIVVQICNELLHLQHNIRGAVKAQLFCSKVGIIFKFLSVYPFRFVKLFKWLVLQLSSIL